MIKHSYRGPANNRPVRSSDLVASLTPIGQYPMRCHGEIWSEMEVAWRRMKVVREHTTVENVTERILARIASGASLDRPTAALVAEDACSGST